MSQVVLYARVPDDLKKAADAFASEQGVTLANAVVELLEGGLQAAADEGSVAALQARVAELSAEAGRLKADLQTASAQLNSLSSFVRRAQQPIGTCPSCREPITGADLLAEGRCRSCKTSLSALIAPAERQSSLDQREVMILVGALGVLVGGALLAARS